MNHLNYGIFDCDTHCYEPRDAFTRYLPKEYLERAMVPVKLANGLEAILAGHRVATFNSESGLGFDLAYRPGSLKEMLKQMGSGNPEETYQPEPMRPEYQKREARITLLEQQGVEEGVVFPSAIALSIENYVKDTRAAYANVHALNQSFDDDWGFNRDG